MKKKSVLAAILVLIFAGVVYAGVPGTIGYQGKLSDAGGIPVDGSVATMTFAIYSTETAGTAIWSEEQTDVLVSSGIFSVELGSVTPIDSSKLPQADLWIGVDVGDGEMTPRQKLASTPFAIKAAVAESADWSGVTNIPAGFSDDTDDDTTYSAGTGLNLDGTTFNVNVPLELAQSDQYSYAINGSNTTTSAYGRLGYGGYGVYGSGSSYGVYGYGSREGVYGSGGDTGTGVYGYSNSSFGVYGYSNSSYGVYASGGVGVYGYGSGSTGVIGYGSYYGVYGLNETGYGAYLGYGTYGVYANGDIAATGTKYFVQPHPTDPTKQINYIAMEGPEAAVFYRGSAQLVNGRATIELPDHFRIVASEEGLQVQVTATADCNGIFVAGKSLDGIMVKELMGGTHNATFDYTVTGIRAGFESEKPVRENDGFIPHAMDTAEDFENRFSGDNNASKNTRRLLIQNGTLTKEGKVNKNKAEELGWKFKEKKEHPEPPAHAGNGEPKGKAAN